MGHPARWEGLERLPGDLKERIERLPSYLAQEGAHLAYLFGSLLEDDGLREEPHDVDLAVLIEDGPVWALRDGLRKLLGT